MKTTARFFLVSFLLLFFIRVSAGEQVGQVVFRQEGNFQFPDEVLRCNVQTKKGLVFSDRVVNEDVRRLYSMGIFSDVASVVEDMPDGRKSITF